MDTTLDESFVSLENCMPIDQSMCEASCSCDDAPSTCGRADERTSGRGTKRVASVDMVPPKTSKKVKVVSDEIAILCRNVQEDKTFEINLELNAIRSAIAREVNGRMSFTKSEQSAIRDSIISIQQKIAVFVRSENNMRKRAMRAEMEVLEDELKFRDFELKLKEIEDENRKLKEQLTNTGRNFNPVSSKKVVRHCESSSDEFTTQRTKRQKKSYADVLAKRRNLNVNGGNKIEGRVVTAGKDGWKTPPLTAHKSEAIVVSSKVEKNSRKLATELSTLINPSDIDGPPKAMHTIWDGKLVIFAKNKSQKEKITDNLKKNSNLNFHKRKSPTPMLVVSGVQKGMSDLDFISKLTLCSEEMKGVSLDDCKIVKRITCRNYWKENIVLRPGVEAFKVLVKKGKIDIDCQIHFVEEYLGVSMCYKCCRFGHITKFCKEKEECYNCSGVHDARTCKSEIKKCVNCLKMFGKVCDHSARSPNCPAMMRVIEMSRERINYNA